MRVGSFVFCLALKTKSLIENPNVCFNISHPGMKPNQGAHGSVSYVTLLVTMHVPSLSSELSYCLCDPKPKDDVEQRLLDPFPVVKEAEAGQMKAVFATSFRKQVRYAWRESSYL